MGTRDGGRKWKGKTCNVKHLDDNLHQFASISHPPTWSSPQTPSNLNSKSVIVSQKTNNPGRRRNQDPSARNLFLRDETFHLFLLLLTRSCSQRGGFSISFRVCHRCLRQTKGKTGSLYRNMTNRRQAEWDVCPPGAPSSHAPLRGFLTNPQTSSSRVGLPWANPPHSPTRLQLESKHAWW